MTDNFLLGIAVFFSIFSIGNLLTDDLVSFFGCLILSMLFFVMIGIFEIKSLLEEKK